METTATTKLRTILLVGILSISMLSAGFVGLGAAAPNHERIPSVDVDDRTPAQANNPANAGPPTHPDEWAVGTSKHSDTMSAEIIVDEETLRGITVTDDVNHEGRDVSISRDALSGSIEEIPDQVTGIHEDGDRWTSDVRISADRVIVYVPHFSTQTITFSSKVSITADPADSGAEFEYNLSSDNISNPNLVLDGVKNTKWNNITKTKNDGDDLSFNIGGNADPINSEVIFTGSDGGFYNHSTVNTEGSGSTDVGGRPLIGDRNDAPIKSGVTFAPQRNGSLNNITLDVDDADGSDYGATADIRISEGLADTTYNEGTLIKSDYDPDWDRGNQTIDLDTSYSVQANTNYTLEFITDSTDNDGTNDRIGLELDTSASSVRYSYNTNPWERYADLFVGINSSTTNPKIDISNDGSTDASYSGSLSPGESVSRDISLSQSDETASISVDRSSVKVSIKTQEITTTVDPTISINSDAGSQTIDYTGELSQGTSADLSSEIDPSLIGGNVSVSVSVSESVSSGPVGSVGLDYSHDAEESKQISYSGEEFSERYSITHQWPHDRPSASITIPWASDRVVDVRSVTVNGQETTQYSAANGELTVDLGSVQSGDQTNVSAVGSKVSVSGGSISVDDPTTQGEDLDSGISVDSLSSQTLEIDVSNSYHVSERDRMIYVPDSSASWSGADPITRIEPGSQTVEIDPTSSSSFRLRSAGVGSSIPSGDAVLRMEDASEPRVSVSPGQTEGDTLKLTYHDTVSGDYYRVVDSEGNALDTDQAESPAEFRISDTTGIFSIEQFTPEAIVSGIQSGAAAVSSGDSLIPPWLALLATLSASIVGLAYVGTRTSVGQSMLGRRLIIGGGIVLGYVGAELVTGERLYRLALDGVSGIIGSSLGAGAGAGSGAISGLVDIGFISLVLGIGLLVGLYAIDQRTGLDIPRAGWGIAGGLISVWIISQLGLGTGVSIGGQQSLSIVLAIGIVLGLLALDQRGILSIPLPLYAGTALLAGVYVLETLAPGSVLGPLQSGLDEVGPLIWLAIIGGSLLLLWVWLRSNRPQIQILGRGGNR